MAKAVGDNGTVTLDIVVEGVGRVNTGLDFDFKGLTSKLVLLNGASGTGICWLQAHHVTMASGHAWVHAG